MTTSDTARPGWRDTVRVYLAPESLRLEVAQTLEAAAKAYRGCQSR